MRFPDYETYEILYAKYLDRDRSHQLIKLAGNIKDKVFVDICCGGGRLTQEAYKEKPKLNIMIDCEARMLSKKYDFDSYAYICIMDVWRAFLEVGKKMKIDVAICQQGVNYWLSENHAKYLYGIMNKGGVFIFNTFNQMPPSIPNVKSYSYCRDGNEGTKHYVEVSWLVGKEVQHIQICHGFKPHVTSFQWLSEVSFRNMLEPYFNIELIREGKTSIYKCIKK